MSKLYDNICILFSELKGKSYSKKVYALITVLILSITYTMYLGIARTPALVKCTYEAWWIQSLPSDKYRFNFTPSDWNKQCQRKRSDGSWIPLERVTDVGVGDESELEVD